MAEIPPLYDTTYAFIVFNTVISAVSLYVMLRLLAEKYVLRKNLAKHKEFVFSQYRLLMLSLLFLTVSHVFRAAASFLYSNFIELISLSTFLIVLKRTWQEFN